MVDAEHNLSMMTQLPTVHAHVLDFDRRNQFPFRKPHPDPYPRCVARRGGIKQAGDGAARRRSQFRTMLYYIAAAAAPPPDDDERDAATDGRTRSDAGEGQGGRRERERRERGADSETERGECTIQFERRPCSARSSPLSFFGLRIFESARHFFFRTPPEARPTDHDREASHDDHARPARKRKPI